jgi:hypothetical protein
MSKRTKELIEEFTDALFNRKRDLYNTIDCLSHSDIFDGHIKNLMIEIDKIDAIVEEIHRIDLISEQLNSKSTKL